MARVRRSHSGSPRGLSRDARDKCSECPTRRWSTPSCEATPLHAPVSGPEPREASSCCCPEGMRPSLRYDSIHVPEIFPRLIVFPEEHLSFDETAVPVDACNGAHVIVGQRLAD